MQSMYVKVLLLRAIITFVTVILILLIGSGVVLLLYRIRAYPATMIIIVLLVFFFPAWALFVQRKSMELSRIDLIHAIMLGTGSMIFFVIVALWSMITSYCFLPILLFANYMAMYTHVQHSSE